MYSYKLHSHPEKLLKDHLLNVKDIGLNVFEKENFENKLDKDILTAITLFHDFGKASSYFQDKLFQRKNHNQNLTFHSDISALACLFYLEEKKISVIDRAVAFLAIKKHHGNLNTNIDDLFRITEERSEYLLQIFDNIDFDEIEEIYKQELSIQGLRDVLNEKLKGYSIRKFRNTFKKELNNDFLIYTKLNLYFSILVFSDKQDCLFNRLLLNSDESAFDRYSVVDDFKKAKFKKTSDNPINRVREKAYMEVENGLDSSLSLFSINLPTGAGKTLTALNAAIKFLEKDKTLKRIIYCLPFTSVIDQNAEVFSNVLKDGDNSLLLKHHHLTELNYSSSFYKDEIFDNNQAENLIETWESKIIITTFYQVMNTIFTGSNRLLKKFTRIHNTVLIFDEIQSIPRKYWLLINRYFKFLTVFFNVKIILVTATLPMIFSEEAEEIKELAVSKKEYFGFFNRIVLDVSRTLDSSIMDIPSFAGQVQSELKTDHKSILIILNTVNSSLELYELLTKAGHEVIYLSSNVVPKHRLDRIKKIKKSKSRCIVVSTQIVEAGVDIDFDIVYRDLAPLDSIFQACGRCNRNGIKNDKGVVKIIRLVNDDAREYSHFIYDAVNLNKTMVLFKDKKIIEEKDFFILSHKYFQEMKNATEENTSFTILNAIQSMDYKTAFYEKNSFKLIDENFDTLSVFLEIDERASDLLNQYEFLLTEQESFEKKVQLKQIFRKMSQYIINVAEKYMANPGDSSFIIVKKNDVASYYSRETGFIRRESTPDYFF